MTKSHAKSDRLNKEFKHMIVRITAVAYMGDYRLQLTFDDDVIRVVDLWPRIKDRKGVFEPLHDQTFFARVSIDNEAGTIVWPNALDWAPDVLYQMEAVG